MIIACIVGISLGILAAVDRAPGSTSLCLGVALVGVSMPIFWLGFLAQQFFAGDLGLLPFGARYDAAGWQGFEPSHGFFLYEAIRVLRSPGA
jgi:peptide/nickel transport system permease protein